MSPKVWKLIPRLGEWTLLFDSSSLRCVRKVGVEQAMKKMFAGFAADGEASGHICA